MNHKCTKADIVDKLYRQHDLLRKDIQLVIEEFMGVIKDELIEGNDVELRGFGSFRIKKRNGNDNARDPRTGDKVVSEPHKVVSFRAGKELREKVRPLDEAD